MPVRSAGLRKRKQLEQAISLTRPCRGVVRDDEVVRHGGREHVSAGLARALGHERKPVPGVKILSANRPRQRQVCRMLAKQVIGQRTP